MRLDRRACWLGRRRGGLGEAGLTDWAEMRRRGGGGGGSGGGGGREQSRATDGQVRGPGGGREGSGRDEANVTRREGEKYLRAVEEGGRDG